MEREKRRSFPRYAEWLIALACSGDARLYDRLAILWCSEITVENMENLAREAGLIEGKERL